MSDDNLSSSSWSHFSVQVRSAFVRRLSSNWCLLWWFRQVLRIDALQPSQKWNGVGCRTAVSTPGWSRLLFFFFLNVTKMTSRDSILIKFGKYDIIVGSFVMLCCLLKLSHAEHKKKTDIYIDTLMAVNIHFFKKLVNYVKLLKNTSSSCFSFLNKLIQEVWWFTRNNTPMA